MTGLMPVFHRPGVMVEPAASKIGCFPCGLPIRKQVMILFVIWPVTQPSRTATCLGSR
jgi:hypothetical protein